jgi:hypothetical protein
MRRSVGVLSKGRPPLFPDLPLSGTALDVLASAAVKPTHPRECVSVGQAFQPDVACQAGKPDLLRIVARLSES